jgi:hypothetical protein
MGGLPDAMCRSLAPCSLMIRKMSSIDAMARLDPPAQPRGTGNSAFVRTYRAENSPFLSFRLPIDLPKA